MNTSRIGKDPDSLFTRPIFWIAFAVFSLGCTIFAFSNADRAFSIVELELRMDRDGALAEAGQFAESFGLGPEAYRQAASFRVDDRSRSFVELEGGGPEAFGDLIREGPYHPYQWVVRHFREAGPHELEVRFLADGTPYGYREQLSEDMPGAALDADTAREIAEGSVGDPWTVDLANYELVESSRLEQPSGRVDHTFVYEHTDREVVEGRFRLSLVVSGDRPTALTHYLQIPGGFRPPVRGNALGQQRHCQWQRAGHGVALRGRRGGGPVRSAAAAPGAVAHAADLRSDRRGSPGTGRVQCLAAALDELQHRGIRVELRDPADRPRP